MPSIPRWMRPVVAIIPARGGSKRIRRKALEPIGNAAHLISLTVQQALSLKNDGWLDEIVVSTDHAQIRRVAELTGRGQLQMIRRPIRLATDRASSVAVVRHALSELHKRDIRTETVVLLQVTSPLRRPVDVIAAIRRFAKGGVDSVVTAAATHPPPEWMYWVGRGRRLGRRLVRWRRRSPSVALNGAVYVSSAHRLMRHGFTDGRCSFVQMPWGLSWDIDEPADLWLAEAVLRDQVLRDRLEGGR